MVIKIKCDILIVGCGVAGLTTAIAVARAGLVPILIDKEAEIGFKIKGEVLKQNAEIFREIFGQGLPEGVILTELTQRRLYSPSTLKYIDVQHTEHTITVDYRLFIIELFRELSKLDCKVFLNTELLDLIKENQTIIGVRCRKDQEEIEISANYFIGADGVHSKFANILEPYSMREIYPALKINYENLQIPNSHRIELYLMNNPPGAMWMFPKSESAGECGIVVWTHDLSDSFDILDLWEKKSKEHKVLKEILTSAKPYYISRDYLNFGGPMKRPFGDNFAVVGDSGGHIGAIGGSGIIAGMSVGYIIGDFIAKTIIQEGTITEGMVKDFLIRFKKTPIQKYLMKEKKLGKSFRNILFQIFKTNEGIDENWYKLEKIYSSARS
ncbi:MAG: NAD(P)/FAD-dependent oxidoreductase [Candidatus Helarchaeota archaeon]